MHQCSQCSATLESNAAVCPVHLWVSLFLSSLMPDAPTRLPIALFLVLG